MDHTNLPVPVAGGSKKALVVRDLSSGTVLSSSPALRGSAKEVAAELERLFLLHGPPLVLKCDNGSPLVAAKVRSLCRRSGVVVLRSPPRRPAYNGSAERGLGWWKALVPGCAESAGHDAAWTNADLERAREVANTMPRERRPPAADVWAARKAISFAERQRFLAAYGAAYEAELGRLGLGPEQVSPGSGLDATIGRTAARAALCDLEYLTIRRR